MHGQLKPQQIALIVGSGPVRDEFSRKVKELNRRLKMNGMDYTQWDTLNDRQHDIFTDNLFLDGECATSPEHYVHGAVESCGCPDTEEDLHHHSPVLMREIEKQQEMLPDMTVKISESLGFLNEMVDKELLALLEQSRYRYTQRKTPDEFATALNLMGGDEEDAEEFDYEFDKEELPPKPEKKGEKKKKVTQSETDAFLQARLDTLDQMEKVAAGEAGNEGDKYELDVLKLLIGNLPGHTLLSARDVVAGSTTKADAAIAIDGKPYDVELKLGAGDPMGSGNIYGEFELLPTGKEGKVEWKPSEGLPIDAFENFLEKYKISELPKQMDRVRQELRDYEPITSTEDERLMQNPKDGKYYLKKPSGKAKGKPIGFADKDYKVSALKKFHQYGASKYPGAVTTAAWNLAGSELGDFSSGARRAADRFTSDPLKTTADFIEKRYLKKGTPYIQIGPGKDGKDPKGLYYFGDQDPAGLKKYGVPPFEIGDHIDFEVRLGAYGSGQGHTRALDMIKGMTNLTDQEREYLLSQPRGFYTAYVVRASARIAEEGAVLKPSPVTLDTKEGVLELVNKLCDDGRFTGVPSLSREGEVLLPAALSYCVLRNLDRDKK